MDTKITELQTRSVDRLILSNLYAIAISHEDKFIKIHANEISQCNIADKEHISDLGANFIHYNNVLRRFKSFCKGESACITYKDLLDLADTYQDITITYGDVHTIEQIKYFSETLIELTK